MSAVPSSAGPDALALLVTAIDEMHQTTSLLPVAEASRSSTRSWWRNVGMLVARGQAEINAGNALQYLADNLERARQHWREALSSLDELQRLHHDNEVVAALTRQLHGAGLNDVLPRLQLDAVPRPTAKAAAHLAAVVDTIHSCEHYATTARNKLNLQRMRAD
jgi:hypothetical protein